MAVDDGHVGDLVPVVLGVVAQHLERPVAVDGVAGHQNPFRLLDQRAPPESSLQAASWLVAGSGETAQTRFRLPIRLVTVAADGSLTED